MASLEIPFRLRFSRPVLIRDAAAVVPGFDNVAMLRGHEPLVPSSTITGRVKDAIREFLRDASPTWTALTPCPGQATGDPTEPFCAGESPSCCMCRIFGAPGGTRRGFAWSGGYYRKEDREQLESLAHAAGRSEAMALSRRGRHQRDERYRRAADDHLWVDGAAVPLFDLHGVVTETPEHVGLDMATRELDRRLLILGMHLVRSIGGHRTKDYGRCEFLPEEDGDTTWAGSVRTVCDEWKRASTAGEAAAGGGA
jgi:hypothetical protein